MKHELTLVRKNSDDAIYRANNADAGKIVIYRSSWFISHVLPADE